MIARWEIRFKRICMFGWLALAGLPFIALAALTDNFVRILGITAAVFLIIPGFVYIYVVVLLHWKDRYRGRHSDLWGALILIETSGWMKLVYIFRHIIPDMRHSGRYRVVHEQPPSLQLPYHPSDAPPTQ
jgi:hypothetical protein